MPSFEPYIKQFIGEKGSTQPNKLSPLIHAYQRHSNRLNLLDKVFDAIPYHDPARQNVLFDAYKKMMGELKSDQSKEGKLTQSSIDKIQQFIHFLTKDACQELFNEKAELKSGIVELLQLDEVKEWKQAVQKQDILRQIITSYISTYTLRGFAEKHKEQFNLEPWRYEQFKQQLDKTLKVDTHANTEQFDERVIAAYQEIQLDKKVELEKIPVKARPMTKLKASKTFITDSDLTYRKAIDTFIYEGKPTGGITVDAKKRQQFFKERPNLETLLKRKKNNPLLEEGKYQDPTNRARIGEYFIPYEALCLIIEKKIIQHKTKKGGLPYNSKNVFVIEDKPGENKLENILSNLHLKEGEDTKIIHIHGIHAVPFYLRKENGQIKCFIVDPEPIHGDPDEIINAVKKVFPNSFIVLNKTHLQKDYYSCSTFAIKALMYFAKHGDKVFSHIEKRIPCRSGKFNLNPKHLMPALLKMCQTPVDVSKEALETIVSTKEKKTLGQYWKEHKQDFDKKTFNTAAIKKKYKYLSELDSTIESDSTQISEKGELPIHLARIRDKLSTTQVEKLEGQKQEKSRTRWVEIPSFEQYIKQFIGEKESTQPNKLSPLIHAYHRRSKKLNLLDKVFDAIPYHDPARQNVLFDAYKKMMSELKSDESKEGKLTQSSVEKVQQFIHFLTKDACQELFNEKAELKSGIVQLLKLRKVKEWKQAVQKQDILRQIIISYISTYTLRGFAEKHKEQFKSEAWRYELFKQQLDKSLKVDTHANTEQFDERVRAAYQEIQLDIKAEFEQKANFIIPRHTKEIDIKAAMRDELTKARDSMTRALKAYWVKNHAKISEASFNEVCKIAQAILLIRQNYYSEKFKSASTIKRDSMTAIENAMLKCLESDKVIDIATDMINVIAIEEKKIADKKTFVGYLNEALSTLLKISTSLINITEAEKNQNSKKHPLKFVPWQKQHQAKQSAPLKRLKKANCLLI